MSDLDASVLALKLIAATAAKAAADLEHSRLWPGQLQEAVRTMQTALSQVKER